MKKFMMFPRKCTYCTRRLIHSDAVDEMSRRVDDLERNVSDLMTHAPSDLDLPADAAASSARTSAAAGSGVVPTPTARV